MKNQYFGDVNDYRKYGLLRVLARSGLSVGVCWLLTSDDGGTDGQFRRYLTDAQRWRRFDPELHNHLRRLLERGAIHAVQRAEDWELIPGASYFSELLEDGADRRDAYFESAWSALHRSQLLFFDPDNGLEVPSTKRGSRGSAEYLYWQEVRQAYSNGHSVLVYQHFPHVRREPFVPFLADRISEQLPGAQVIGLETSHVAFLLAAQPAHAAVLQNSALEVTSIWQGQIWLRCGGPV